MQNLFLALYITIIYTSLFRNLGNGHVMSTTSLKFVLSIKDIYKVITLYLTSLCAVI